MTTLRQTPTSIFDAFADADADDAAIDGKFEAIGCSQSPGFEDSEFPKTAIRTSEKYVGDGFRVLAEELWKPSSAPEMTNQKHFKSLQAKP